MAGTRQRVASRFNQVALLLMGLVILALTVSFIRQVGISHQRRLELAGLDQAVQRAKAEQEALADRLEYAQSDEAVRDWALRHSMSQPGEVVVMLVPPAGDAPASEAETSNPAARADSVRSSWWNLFFGPP
jgi:cell division protein FtsB